MRDIREKKSTSGPGLRKSGVLFKIDFYTAVLVQKGWH